jgi:hypothetical protein
LNQAIVGAGRSGPWSGCRLQAFRQEATGSATSNTIGTHPRQEEFNRDKGDGGDEEEDKESEFPSFLSLSPSSLLNLPLNSPRNTCSAPSKITRK